ncbi:MAG: type II secretion system pseudopilin PulG [Parcubacteria bacterium C7867-005]|nr:MAG: type II secretion system pseudopilin PulG [Parcubacteria bacterium C7867-005]
MKKRGFTLIELLVVIAIIGLLSSVVLASLSIARTKSRDASIVSGVLEFRKLMELEYSNVGSYTNLNQGWVGTTVNPTCALRGYSGVNAAQAVSMCGEIQKNITSKSANDFHTGVDISLGFSNSRQYSIMARLSTGQYFCAGSSGKTSKQGNSGNGWTGTGCYGNP